MPFTRSLSECPAQAADRQTSALAGLAITLLLVVVGLYLLDTLRACSDTQDCLLSGRTACSVVF